MASEEASKWWDIQTDFYRKCNEGNRTTILGAYESGAASQRELMGCGHPRACWVRRIVTCMPSQQQVEIDGYCEFCVALASRDAEVKELREDE